jgi:hypothetical protein
VREEEREGRLASDSQAIIPIAINARRENKRIRQRYIGGENLLLFFVGKCPKRSEGND